MRLHSLRVRAFGPFAGEERVDFDALAESGLFLFHGATGAGKTSLLDAVCFALYGQVPGARGGSRLRSDHAPVDARAQVELELTVRGRRLRVSRWPAWERPKRRGTGTTTEPAKVRVEEVGPDGSATLTTRIDEAGLLLGDLLRMSHSQFTQVALLPQGQFAQFLRAGADERRTLLTTLFDTGRFSAVEAHLVGLRQTRRRALEESERRMADIRSRVAAAAGLDDDQRDALGPTQMAEVVAGAAEGLRTAEAAQLAAAVARGAAAAEHARVAALAERQTRRQELARRTAVLEARAPERRELAAALEASRRAAPVVHGAGELVLLTSRLHAAVRAVATEPGLRSLGVDLDVVLGDAVVGGEALVVADRLRAREGDARQEAGALGELLEVARDVDDARAELVRLEQAQVEQGARRDELARWQRDLPARRGAAERRLADARAAAGRLEVLDAQLEALDTRVGAAAQRRRLAEAVTEAAAARSAAVDAAQRATDTWLSLRRRRLEGIAAELAARLEQGVPCSVCGSRDHPAPAGATADAVDRADEDAARAAVERLEAARSAAETEHARVDRALAQVETVAGSATEAELEALRASVAAERAALGVRAADVGAAHAALTELQQQADLRTADQQKLAAELARTSTTIEELRTRVVELGARVDEARGDDPSVDARQSRLLTVADAAAALAGRLAEAGRLHDEVARMTAAADAAATQAGFADLTAARAALLTEARATAADETLRGLAAEEAALGELRADPTITGPADEVVDLARAARALAEAEQGHESAVAARSTAAERHAALTRLAHDLAVRLAEHGPVREAFDVVDRISRLAEGKSGDNRLKMSLTAYVLAARLEQVAVAASERLGRMSDGRYRLVHTALSPKGRGGLHLDVVDSWTGQARDPATLSGGETFYASLALALGLADVVMAEAGGTSVETLFVDEGFGSLDDETLDEVMDVLDGLRSGGRSVGVVSHVPDLRQRIPAQVRVRKGRTGSTVEQTVAGPAA